MSRPRTCATGPPPSIELTTDQLMNLRLNREWRYLQSTLQCQTRGETPAVVEIGSTYETRRQVFPSTSTDTPLQYFMGGTMARIDTPEGSIIHETTLPMGRGMYTNPIPPYWNPYTRSYVTAHTLSNPPTPWALADEQLELPDQPADASSLLNRHTPDHPTQQQD